MSHYSIALDCNGWSVHVWPNGPCIKARLSSYSEARALLDAMEADLESVSMEELEAVDGMLGRDGEWTKHCCSKN